MKDVKDNKILEIKIPEETLNIPGEEPTLKNIDLSLIILIFSIKDNKYHIEYTLKENNGFTTDGNGELKIILGENDWLVKIINQILIRFLSIKIVTKETMRLGGKKKKKSRKSKKKSRKSNKKLRKSKPKRKSTKK